MKLRSGLSYWHAIDPPLPDFPSLQGDTRCEVAVVGGGITGALTAYFLVRAGVDALLIDKRDLGTGSTAASTGLLQYEVDVPLVELISKVGEQHAVRAYRRGVEAIAECEQLVRELDDPCGFSRRQSLYFASEPKDLPQLRREFECRRDFGFDVQFWDGPLLASASTIPAPGAIWSRDDGQIDPYRFTARLFERAQAGGLRVFANTALQKLLRTDDSFSLVTPAGRIETKSIVMAGGYESAAWLDHDVGRLHTTYAVASEPLTRFDGWPEGCLVWETARPYFYARQTDDGRATIGGEDTAAADDHEDPDLLARKAERLAARFSTLFPRIPFVPEFAWAGTFGESRDGLAYIGTPPGREREYFAVGYGGNGITFGLIAARLITDLLLGRPNADAAVFRFGR